ncbi:MAG: hypothetical protein WCL42_09455 [Chlorobiaceae bacterium]
MKRFYPAGRRNNSLHLSSCNNAPDNEFFIVYVRAFLYTFTAHISSQRELHCNNKIRVREMTKLAEFLQDGKGVFSSTRLGFLMWVIGTLVVWIVGSMNVINAHNQPLTFPDIPTSVQIIIASLMAGKAVQSFSPNEADSSATQPAAPDLPATKP